MTGLTKGSLADALSALVSSVAVRTRAFIYMPAWDELWAAPPHPGTMGLLLTSLSLVKRRKEAGKVVRLKDTPRLPAWSTGFCPGPPEDMPGGATGASSSPVLILDSPRSHFLPSLGPSVASLPPESSMISVAHPL